MIKTKIFVLVTVLIALLFFTRFWKLGSLPDGMTWDEAAIAYNGFALITTRRDEWLQFLPVSLKSFGDYKSPLAAYITSPFVFLLGSEVWAFRVPFAVFGVAAIIGIGALTKIVFETQTKPSDTNKSIITITSIAAIFWLTLSPWHIHFSRAGFESGMALALVIWGMYFLFQFQKQLEQPNNSSKLLGYGAASSLLLLSSMYVYHSSKVTVPLLAAITWLLFKKKTTFTMWFTPIVTLVVFIVIEYLTGISSLENLLKNMYMNVVMISPEWSGFLSFFSVIFLTLLLFTSLYFFISKKSKKILIMVSGTVFVSALLMIPLLRDSFYGPGSERLAQTSLWKDGEPIQGVATALIRNAIAHLSPSFLLFGETTTLRHGTGAWGVLLATDYILFFCGILFLIMYIRDKENVWYYPFAVYGFFWIISGLMPAIIGQEVPHANRSLLAAPGYFMLLASGGIWIYEKAQQYDLKTKIRGTHGETNVMRGLVVGCFILFHSLLFLSYWNYYTTTFAKKSAGEYSSGSLEMAKIVMKYEKGLDGKKEVDQILLSSKMGQPYIYLLLARRTNPIWYQGGSLIKYMMVDSVKESDLSRTNTLIVATYLDNLDFSKADEVIYNEAGEPRFALFLR